MVADLLTLAGIRGDPGHQQPGLPATPAAISSSGVPNVALNSNAVQGKRQGPRQGQHAAVLADSSDDHDGDDGDGGGGGDGETVIHEEDETVNGDYTPPNHETANQNRGRRAGTRRRRRGRAGVVVNSIDTTTAGDANVDVIKNDGFPAPVLVTDKIHGAQAAEGVDLLGDIANRRPATKGSERGRQRSTSCGVRVGSGERIAPAWEGRCGGGDGGAPSTAEARRSMLFFAGSTGNMILLIAS